MESSSGLEVFLKERFKLDVMCYLTAGIHFTYLIMFLLFGIMPLMYFNIFSVIFYAGIGLYARTGKAARNIKYFITAVQLEIVIYSLLCTLTVGFGSMFFMLALVSLPVGIYYLFVYSSARTFKCFSVAYLLDVILSIGIEITVIENVGDIHERMGGIVTDGQMKFMRYLNIMFVIAMLFVYTLMFCAEISDLLRQLRYTASHDALTGLSNRNDLWNFFDSLENSGKTFSVTMGDLDDFKKINDTYGHDCGDLVLKSVAKIISESVHDGEMACRWGGEEMLIIMTGNTDECFERVKVIREKINDLKIVYDERPVKVTMTLGFACSPEKEKAKAEYSGCDEKIADNKKHSITAESLIAMADNRLYTGKKSGKNVVINQ